jgi:hypothetical protein
MAVLSESYLLKLPYVFYSDHNASQSCLLILGQFVVTQLLKIVNYLSKFFCLFVILSITNPNILYHPDLVLEIFNVSVSSNALKIKAPTLYVVNFFVAYHSVSVKYSFAFAVLNSNSKDSMNFLHQPVKLWASIFP